MANCYNKDIAVTSMGNWSAQKWIKRLDIKSESDSSENYYPCFVLADHEGKKLGTLSNYRSTADIKDFFDKHLPSGNNAVVPENRLEVIFSVDRLLSPYEEFTSGKYAELQSLVKQLGQKFKGYQSMTWLENVSRGMDNFTKKTSRYNLKLDILPIVKIAPDLASYYEEISKWENKAICPVLLGNNQWSIKFIRAFKPEKIIQLSPKGNTTSSEQIVLNALSGGKGSVLAQINKLNLAKMNGIPTGLVIIDPENDAAPAGTALAMARCQQVMFRKSSEKLLTLLTFEKADAVRKEIMAFLEKNKIPYKNYGTDLDGLTIACGIPFLYNGTKADAEKGRRVLDYLITRTDSGAPWGAAGRLLGDREYMVYQAMCSIFLPPAKALFFSRYSESGRPWKCYSPAKAAELYAAYMPQRSSRSVASSLGNWEKLTNGGNTASEVFINSSGSSHKWSVSGGNTTAASINDSVPCRVHIIHSGSAAAPLVRSSIMRRWMDAGAYIYFGSMAEPLLEAFVTPNRIVRRQLNGYPFGMACRSISGPYSFPWRLICIGDPLTPLYPGAKRLSFKKFEGKDVFTDVYNQDWEKVLRKLQKAKINSAVDYNLLLLANAQCGKSQKIIEMLNSKVPYPLWIEIETQILRQLRKHAETTPKDKRKCIMAMLRISSGDVLLAEYAEFAEKLPPAESRKRHRSHGNYCYWHERLTFDAPQRQYAGGIQTTHQQDPCSAGGLHRI